MPRRQVCVRPLSSKLSIHLLLSLSLLLYYYELVYWSKTGNHTAIIFCLLGEITPLGRACSIRLRLFFLLILLICFYGFLKETTLPVVSKTLIWFAITPNHTNLLWHLSGKCLHLRACMMITFNMCSRLNFKIFVK